MTRTAYARGADFERRVRARLTARGYLVWRTAGSKTPVDLLARLPNSSEPFLFIQVDGSQRGKGRKERVALAELARSCEAEAVVVQRGMTFRFVGADDVLTEWTVRPPAPERSEDG